MCTKSSVPHSQITVVVQRCYNTEFPFSAKVSSDCGFLANQEVEKDIFLHKRGSSCYLQENDELTFLWQTDRSGVHARDDEVRKDCHEQDIHADTLSKRASR